jgi:hypothetical protein
VVRQVLGSRSRSARADAPKLAGEWEHELTTLPRALTVASESLLALTNRVIAYLNHAWACRPVSVQAA